MVENLLECLVFDIGSHTSKVRFGHFTVLDYCVNIPKDINDSPKPNMNV